MKDWGNISLYYIINLHPNEHMFSQLIRQITQLLVQIPINIQYHELSIEYHKIIAECLKNNK